LNYDRNIVDSKGIKERLTSYLNFEPIYYLIILNIYLNLNLDPIFFLKIKISAIVSTLIATSLVAAAPPTPSIYYKYMYFPILFLTSFI